MPILIIVFMYTLEIFARVEVAHSWSYLRCRLLLFRLIARKNLAVVKLEIYKIVMYVMKNTVKVILIIIICIMNSMCILRMHIVLQFVLVPKIYVEYSNKKREYHNGQLCCNSS